MKTNISKLVCLILALALTFSLSAFSVMADNAPSVSSGSPIKCYTIASSGRVYCYTDSSLSKRGSGWVSCSADECYIISTTNNGNALYISYPLDSGGRASRWFSAADFLVHPLNGSMTTAITTAQITTYRHPNCNERYGYTGTQEKIYILGVSNSYYTQIIYPLSAGGYKAAFVKTSELQNGVRSSVQNGIVSDSELQRAVRVYGISTGTTAYQALLSINSRYTGKLTSSQKAGTLVFMFEGAGSDASSAKRFNAMCVVVKNGMIVYLNRNSTSIPDYPFSPEMNDDTDMPTLKSGIYQFTTVNHRGQYAALNVNNAKVVRFRSQYSYYESSSEAINIHRRSSDSIPKKSLGWVNSAGCQLVGAAGKKSDSEYARFLQAVGVIGSNQPATSTYSNRVTGTYVVDRIYAQSYLVSVGYPSGALNLIG